MADSIIIYTQESCMKCQSEKQWLDENKVEYTEKDIRNDSDAMEEVMNLGATATPVTVVRNKDKEEVVMGFDQERLALLLNL